MLRKEPVENIKRCRYMRQESEMGRRASLGGECPRRQASTGNIRRPNLMRWRPEEKYIGRRPGIHGAKYSSMKAPACRYRISGWIFEMLTIKIFTSQDIPLKRI